MNLRACCIFGGIYFSILFGILSLLGLEMGQHCKDGALIVA